MVTMLTDRYYTLIQVLALLSTVLGACAIGFWVLWLRWRKITTSLEQELARAQSEYDEEHLRALHDHLQSVVAHESVTGLRFIISRSTDTLERLGQDEETLRDKQKRIIAKAREMTQRARNTVDLYGTLHGDLDNQLVNMRHLVERVLGELSYCVDDEDVTLKVDLNDIEPMVLDKHLTAMAHRNVIHNAIKYSNHGGVVEVSLYLQADEESEEGEKVVTQVKDRGGGIPEEEHERVFELQVRGDGLIKPGSGLGLYCARRAARRQGGDVILVSSEVNKGSVFQIVFPYRAARWEESLPDVDKHE